MSEQTTLNIDCFKSIDGNWIRNPVGYCTYHKGYVSDRQARVHRCHRKHGGTCGRLKDMEGRYIKKMRTDQYYDKMISRMDKMIVAMNKLTKTIEDVEKWRNGMCISLTDDDVPKKEDMKPKSLEAIEKAEEQMNKYSDQLNEMA